MKEKHYEITKFTKNCQKKNCETTKHLNDFSKVVIKVYYLRQVNPSKGNF